MKRFVQVLVVIAFFVVPLSAHAASATVTNNGDAAIGSTCIAPVACSLRQAIQRVNSDALTDTIEFAIPGAGPHVIAPISELPILARPVAINGYSQAGAVVNSSATGFNAVLKIQLSGINMLSGSAGLRLRAATDSSSVQGLSITGFSGTGARAVEAGGAGIVSITGCGIGVTPAFTLAGNDVGILASANQIGAVRIGTLSASSPQATNLISNNVQAAIALNATTTAPTGNSFIGHNLINLSADGITFLAPGNFAVLDRRGGSLVSGNAIGGTLRFESVGFSVTGNSITASNSPISFMGPAIGTGNVGGASLLANTLTRTGTGQNVIGHDANAMNIDLSLNRVVAASDVLGIDLGVNGVTANDPGDSDAGPNGLQNFPVLARATRTSATGVISVNGSLNSLPHRSFRLVFYANPAAVRAGEFLGDSATDVTTDAGGNVSFGPLQLNFGNGATVVNNLSATATLIDNVSLLPLATSEFAASIPIQLVTPPARFTVTSVDDPGNGVCDSSCTLREAIVAANATGSATAIDEIRFNIPGIGPHTIILGSALPTLTQSVTIDGYTQPGALVNTDATGVGTNAVIRIEIRPVPAATFSLFGGDINAANVTLRGLSLTQFDSTVFLEFLGVDMRVEGCWIGIRPDGIESGTSITWRISGSGGVFGGPTPAQRNVWLSNKAMFIANGLVENNLFGVLPSGRIASNALQLEPNARLSSLDSIVRQNVFSRLTDGFSAARAFRSVFIDNAVGESFDGLTAFGSTGVIFSNDYATLASDTHRIRNAQGVAVEVSGSGIYTINQAILGGTGKGVLMNSAFGSTSIRASISGTADLGIDLNGDGVTLNDSGDSDTGSNGLQNFPVLTSAVRNNTAISVTGTLNSLPNQNFRILICGIGAEHVSLHGGCDEVLDDQTIVTTAANGNIAFSVTLENNPAHNFITATASRIVSATEEQTSEFALNIPITGFQEIIFANSFEGL